MPIERKIQFCGIPVWREKVEPGFQTIRTYSYSYVFNEVSARHQLKRRDAEQYIILESMVGINSGNDSRLIPGRKDTITVTSPDEITITSQTVLPDWEIDEAVNDTDRAVYAFGLAQFKSYKLTEEEINRANITDSSFVRFPLVRKRTKIVYRWTKE